MKYLLLCIASGITGIWDGEMNKLCDSLSSDIDNIISMSVNRLIEKIVDCSNIKGLVEAEMYCAIVSFSRYCTLKDGQVDKLAEYLLNVLLSGELDCKKVAEYCSGHLKYSTGVVKIMIAKLIKMCELDYKIINGELTLGEIKDMMISTCSDYYEMDKIIDENLDFERVNMRSKVDIKTDKMKDELNRILKLRDEYNRIENRSSKMSKEYNELIEQNLENRMKLLKKRIDDLETRGIHVLYCLIGMLKSKKHTIAFYNNYKVGNKKIIELVGADNVDGAVSMYYGGIVEEFCQALKNLQYLEISSPFEYLCDDYEKLDLLFNALKKAKGLAKARIGLPNLPEYKEFFEALKVERIEVVLIVRKDFTEFIRVLNEMKGKSVRNVNLCNWEICLTKNDKETIENIKKGLSGIADLEGVDFVFDIEDFMSVGLDGLVNELGLRYVSIRCYNHGFDTIEEFMRSIVDTVEKVVVYAGRKKDEAANIARKMLNETSGDRVVEIVVVKSGDNMSFLSNREN